jgi:hypothetical protein
MKRKVAVVLSPVLLFVTISFGQSYSSLQHGIVRTIIDGDKNPNRTHIDNEGEKNGKNNQNGERYRPVQTA